MINLTDRISFYSRFVILWFILITVVDVCWWTAISIRTFRITNSWFTPPTLNLIANCFFSDSLDIFRPLEITNSWFTPKSWLNSICELLFQWFPGYLLSSIVNHEFDHILQLWIMNLITFCEKNKQICEYYELYHICVNTLIKCLSLFPGYLLLSIVNHEFDHILWKKQANLWILWIISHLREQID